MNKLESGFTLIEVLVAVLIIGILVGMALPQYRRSVEKTHAMQAVSLIETILSAEQRYYLLNNRYTDNLDDLDITVPHNTGNWDFVVSISRGMGTVLGRGQDLTIKAYRSKNGVHATGDLGYCLAMTTKQAETEDHRKAEWDAMEAAKAEEDPEYEPQEYYNPNFVPTVNKICKGSNKYCPTISAATGYTFCQSNSPELGGGFQFIDGKLIEGGICDNRIKFAG